MLTLRVLDGPKAGKARTFDQAVLMLGRTKKGHVVLDDPDVSRLHALIEVLDEESWIIDLGSESGTIVNGTRINKTALRVRDVIRIGRHRILVEAIAGTPARVEPASDPEVPRCTRCRAALRESPFGHAGDPYRGVPLRALRCDACKVVYVERRTFEERSGCKLPPRGSPAERARRPAKGTCPRCRGDVERLTLAWGEPWVMLEECPSCGLLALDEGEVGPLAELAALLERAPSS